ncbi:MAG: hypothetical protein A2X78_02460 [Gammaproteobacteria bacterium GWE2_37_16]|nr:MAG: hypothetical protein A2X78_02460 [Gammaproteobacteria bacterium GWE2_37_16]
MKKIISFVGILVLLNTLTTFAANEPVKITTPAPVATATTVPTPPTTYPEPSKQMLTDFEQYVQKTMQDWNIPGMAIGVVQGDKVIYAKGFGVKALGSSDPVTPDTIFQIGSVTKSFTAALMAMLVDENKIRWNDKVTDYLPDFMLYDPWVTRDFQIVDLMSQRSGLPSHAGDQLYLLGYDRSYIKHALRYIQPSSSFRSQYTYLNVFFLNVADLIEKLSGKSWEQNVDERIFKPLAMTNSSVDMQSYVTAKNVALPHVKINDKVTLLPKDWPYFGWVYTAGPAGSINSNITDMVKWLSFQMNDGRIKDKQLISENNMNFMHSPITPTLSNPNGENMYYCLGWAYRENNPEPVIWHDGDVTGMKSTIAFTPKSKVGIIILSNFGTEMPELLAFRFFDQYFGKKLIDYSSAMLKESIQANQQMKKLEPVAPKKPRASLPLEKYTGNYVNKIYGVANISLVDGKLVIAIGNKGVFKMTLKHWDKDTFAAYGTLYSKKERNGFINFEVDLNGNIQNLAILAPLNEKFIKIN